MGGCGSGRKSGKSAVEDCLKLSLSKMLQHRQLTEHDSVQTVSWTNHFNELLACFTFRIVADGTDLLFYVRELEQKINLSSTSLHFGGKRWWFHCPYCNRRCANLSYAKRARKFYCRLCLDLTYRSCQESHKYDGLYAHLAMAVTNKGTPVTAPEVAQILSDKKNSQRPKWKRKRDRGKKKKMSKYDLAMIMYRGE